MHRSDEQLVEHRHPGVVVQRDDRIRRQEEENHLPSNKKEEMSATSNSLGYIYDQHAVFYAALTENFSDLYMVVCVMAGVPSVAGASLFLKKGMSGLRPKSSGLILSANSASSAFCATRTLPFPNPLHFSYGEYVPFACSD